MIFRNRAGLCLLAALALLVHGSCGDDAPPKGGDGGVKDGTSADHAAGPENSATSCNDGVDNDGDGDTDCQDSDCLAFAFCGGGIDAAPPDAPAPDAGPDPDGPVADGPQPDAPAPDMGVDLAADIAADTAADAGVDIAADTLAHDTLAHDTLAHDTLAHDTLAHDTLAHDTLAHDTTHDTTVDTTSCGNGICELGETCDVTYTADGGATINACPADCPGDLTINPGKLRYCCVEGICVGDGCTQVPIAPENCNPAP